MKINVIANEHLIILRKQWSRDLIQLLLESVLPNPFSFTEPKFGSGLFEMLTNIIW